MKFKQTIILAFLLLFIAVSCKSTKPVLPSNTNTVKTITITQVLRDTIFKVEKDSSYYKAWLKCQDNKIVIVKEKKSPTTASKLLQPPSVSIVDNVLQVDCEARAQELFFQWQEKFKEEVTQTEIRTPYPVERNLTWFQSLCIILGKGFLIIIAGSIILFILKLKNYIS
jgi:hypothetical protein